MAFLSRLLGRKQRRRVCFIGLDGTPYGLLKRLIDEGVTPNIGSLVQSGSMSRMHSVYPWVSSVAWTSWQTGVNPAKHGIFGFIDRDPQTMKTFIPLSTHCQRPTLWDLATAAGKSSVVINVPVTYPVKPLNGSHVCGFLAPKLTDKSVYPATLLPVLEHLGYRIDTDPWLARESRAKAMPDIEDALEKRLHAIEYLMDEQDWDLFVAVVMETDRLHHFFYRQMEENDPVWAPAFFNVYRRIDTAIGRLVERLDDNTTVILMSDHGFCSIEKEVFYNHWLAEAGFMHYTKVPAQGLQHLAPESAAYSMDPGRVFVNLQGREKTGRVEPGAEYERVRDELITAAENLMDPETGQKMVEKAYRREELYEGPLLEAAADVILAPVNGYDPKGAFYNEHFTHRDDMMVGMHTYDDAMLVVGEHQMHKNGAVSILDVAPTILDLMGVEAPPDLDGRNLLDR